MLKALQDQKNNGYDLSEKIVWNIRHIRIKKSVEMCTREEKAMDHAYSILMFCFAGALLLYGILLFATKDINLVPRSSSAKFSDGKTYARQFGKIIMATSLVPLSSGLIAWNGRVAFGLVVLVIGFIACIWESTRMI